MKCTLPLDFPPDLCNTKYMLNRSDLITAVLNDYAQMCADDPSDDNLSLDSYREQLDAYTDDQLLRECCVTFDDDFTVDDYIALHS